MIFIGILISIIIFSLLIIIHEYGHYKSARIFGIHVEEFGLGIPPRAKKLWKNKDGTLFSLNWIPLGGFVKIAGEQEITLKYYSKKGNLLDQKSLSKKLEKKSEIYNASGQEISKEEIKLLKKYLKSYKSGQNFFEKNILQKSIVLLAGVIMNFLTAIAIFTFLFFIGVKPVGINSVIETDLPSKLIPTLEQSIAEGVIIQEAGVVLYPLPESGAAGAGVQDGDIVLGINEINFGAIPEIQNYISAQANNSVNMYIERISEGSVEYLEIQVPVNSEGKIGSYLAPNYQIQEDFQYKYGLVDALKHGTLETYYQIRLTLSGLSMLITNIFTPETPEDRSEALQQVAGPIGIVGVISEAVIGGWKLILVLAAIISINLGVFNLLPIPALDGGRLVLLWIRTGLEKMFGKNTYFSGIENLTHIFFFILLIALSILIAYNDVINIFSR